MREGERERERDCIVYNTIHQEYLMVCISATYSSLSTSYTCPTGLQGIL